MNKEKIQQIFHNKNLIIGRIISPYKNAPKNNVCVWNANVMTKENGKVWYGDLNLTKDYKKLNEICGIIGKTLYVLKEEDCRFGKENDSIDSLIQKAVWNTNL